MTILTGEGLSRHLREICDAVKDRLWVAVPFIGDPKAVTQLLGNRWIKDERLDVRVLTDTDNAAYLNAESIERFRTKGTIKHLRGLHAKIYIADDRAVLTSANLTRTAFARRFEVGTIIEAESIKPVIELYKTWWKRAQDVDPTWFRNHQTQRKKKDDRETKEGSSLPNQYSLPNAPEDLNPKIAYWLTTLASDDGEGEQWLKRSLTKYHYYAFGRENPKHVEVKAGDLICFYAAPNGVVAHATIASRTENRVRPDGKRYKEYPWVCSVTEPCLYLNQPMEIDAALRQKLDAFKDRDRRNNWGWFVQVTRELSQHDFMLLTQSG
jgi:PLD-like domain